MDTTRKSLRMLADPGCRSYMNAADFLDARVRDATLARRTEPEAESEAESESEPEPEPEPEPESGYSRGSESVSGSGSDFGDNSGPVVGDYILSIFEILEVENRKWGWIRSDSLVRDRIRAVREARVRAGTPGTPTLGDLEKTHHIFRAGVSTLTAGDGRDDLATSRGNPSIIENKHMRHTRAETGGPTLGTSEEAHTPDRLTRKNYKGVPSAVGWKHNFVPPCTAEKMRATKRP